MIHNMKLHPAPFEMIKSGKKTIELRLFDESVKKSKSAMRSFLQTQSTVKR